MKRGLGLGRDFYHTPKPGGVILETQRFMLEAGVPNDGTVYYAGTAYEITGAAMWTALTTAVNNTKDIFSLPQNQVNLYQQLIAWYIRIAGTATTHRLNLVDPATFVGTFNGGWTHDGSGALPNGTNGFFDTNCNAMNNLFINNVSAFINLKTEIDDIGVEMFAVDGARGDFFMRPRLSNVIHSALSQTADNYTVANTSSLGIHSMNRNVNTEYKVKRDTTALGTGVKISNPPLMSNTNILEGCYGGPIQFSPRKRTLFGVAKGMTDQQVTDLTAVWNQFDADLFR